MERINRILYIKLLVAVTAVLLFFPGISAAQERLCVKAGIANMRSGPGTKYDVLWQAEKYYPVVVTQKKGNWYKIKDFENDVAWVHNSLLEKEKTVIAKKDKCNIRSKGSMKGSIVFTVDKGVPFKVLQEKGNWIKIKHADGDVGWIYKTLVW